jgi:hypothetical protein
MTPEAELIRALAEDLALEILASYTLDDFKDADFTSLGKAALYLAEHEEGPGPALQEVLNGGRDLAAGGSQPISHLRQAVDLRAGLKILWRELAHLSLADDVFGEPFGESDQQV